MATLDELKKNSAYFTLAMVLIFVVLVLGFLVIRKLFNAARHVDREIAANIEVEKAYKTKLENLRALRQNYVALEGSRPEFRKHILGALPDDVDKERFIVAFRNLALRSGWALKSVAFNQAAAPGLTPSVRVTFAVHNSISYKAFLNFLDFMYNGARLNNIKKITLEGTDNSADIEFEIYYQPFTAKVGEVLGGKNQIK